jgi:hypothetical protein
MNKTPGVMPGVSVHASERDTPTRNRPRIQATEPMRLRLRALLWGEDWRGGAWS